MCQYSWYRSSRNALGGRGHSTIPFHHSFPSFHSATALNKDTPLVALAWFPKFLKSRSRPLEHHRPAFVVYQLLIRLLTCYIVTECHKALQCFVLPIKVYVPHLKNCAPPLKLALHYHSCDPNFITTHRLADNRPTL